jgi:putative transposase
LLVLTLLDAGYRVLRIPRMARVVIPSVAHHMTQRGNRCEDVFFGDDDRRRYLELLAEYSAKHGLAIRGCYLTPNHVHLLVVPARMEPAGTLS